MIDTIALGKDGAKLAQLWSRTFREDAVEFCVPLTGDSCCLDSLIQNFSEIVILDSLPKTRMIRKATFVANKINMIDTDNCSIAAAYDMRKITECFADFALVLVFGTVCF